MYRYLLALFVLCTGLRAQVSYWSAYLDGAHESPVVVTSAHGWAIVRHDAQTNAVRVFCYAAGLSTQSTGAQLHQGTAGINGPVVLNLVASGPNEWTGNGVLTAAQASALPAQGLYLNVHSVAFPAGEIRGQVTRSQNTRLTAVLSGTQVAPPATTVASGVATAFLFEPENRLAYGIEVAGIASITAAHLHVGTVGANGPILDVPVGANGSWCGVTGRLSDSDVAALRAGQCYADVHSSQFPNGEIRGQMRADLGSHYVASCTGTDETPPTASQALCTAQLVVTPDDRIELSGAYSGIAPISAHVHTGPKGIAGPILFTLNAQGGTLSGNYGANASELANLRAGLWYVNVHSNTFPNGEIRGQLTARPLPTTYGEGCRTSTGRMPLATTHDLASLGSPLEFALYGAECCNLALLVIGLDRSTNLAVNLPSMGFQAPDCHALTDVVLSNLGATDPFGCARMTLAVPFDQVLRGASMHLQWLLVDPAANAIGLVVSNASTFTIL